MSVFNDVIDITDQIWNRAVEVVIAIIDSLTPQQMWLAGIVVAIFFGSFGALNYLAGRKERKLKTYETTPEVRATINRQIYPDGWRSVQLHIMGASEEQQFRYNDWHIERAILLRPGSAVLARAEKDDYATGVFYPETPIRTLDGRVEGKPQRFALEFFMKFKGDDRGKKAKFKVSFARISKPRRFITKVWATVPPNADSKTPPEGVSDAASVQGMPGSGS